MSDLKKEVTDKILDIRNTITNASEAEKVLKDVSDIIDIFSGKLLELTKRQTKLEERTEEVFEMLSNIEEELYNTMMDNFQAECPYCGEDVMESIPEDGSDFECPHCHNVIELEMMFEDSCGCGCDCEDCGDDCDCGCEDCDCDDDCDCGCEDK